MLRYLGGLISAKDITEEGLRSKSIFQKFLLRPWEIRKRSDDLEGSARQEICDDYVPTFDPYFS